jgi:DNA-binding MarR family transcriptional regulator
MPTRTVASAQLDEAAVAAQLRLSVTRLARRLRQESGSGYSPSQLSALAVIDNHGPLTLGALADHERVAPPSITKVVAKLEAEGLVQRTTDPSDRRVTHVATTTAGRTLIAETRRRKTTWLTERVRELPDDELARLADALDVLDHLIAQEERP